MKREQLSRKRYSSIHTAFTRRSHGDHTASRLGGTTEPCTRPMQPLATAGHGELRFDSSPSLTKMAFSIPRWTPRARVTCVWAESSLFRCSAVRVEFPAAILVLRPGFERWHRPCCGPRGPPVMHMSLSARLQLIV